MADLVATQSLGQWKVTQMTGSPLPANSVIDLRLRSDEQFVVCVRGESDERSWPLSAVSPRDLGGTKGYLGLGNTGVWVESTEKRAAKELVAALMEASAASERRLAAIAAAGRERAAAAERVADYERLITQRAEIDRLNAHETAAGRTPRTQWEYTEVVFRNSLDGKGWVPDDPELANEPLDYLGRYGWEMTAMIPVAWRQNADQGAVTVLQGVFKRPLVIEDLADG